MATPRYTGKRVRLHWTLAQRLAFYTAPPNERGCRLWTGARNKDGYGNLGWEGKVHAVHRLTWIEARGPIPGGLYVCHTCDVRHCRELDHLFLGTHDINQADKVAKGRQARGEMHSEWTRGELQHSAKLTADQVRAIRADTRRVSEIARQYGIVHSAVCNIKSGRRWKHI